MTERQIAIGILVQIILNWARNIEPNMKVKMLKVAIFALDAIGITRDEMLTAYADTGSYQTALAIIEKELQTRPTN
jgi:hypothetical protein